MLIYFIIIIALINYDQFLSTAFFALSEQGIVEQNRAHNTIIGLKVKTNTHFIS